MSIEPGTAGSDQSCINFYADAATTATTCCVTMKLKSIDITSTGDADINAQLEAGILDGLSQIEGMPTEVGDQLWAYL